MPPPPQGRGRCRTGRAAGSGRCPRWPRGSSARAAPCAASGVRSAAAIGSPSGRTNAGASAPLGMPRCARSSRQRRASGSSGRSATRRAVTSSAVAPAASSASHSRDWRATSALRWNSSRRRVQLALGLAGEGARERLAAPDRAVDLVARVVVLEDDGDLADLRQPAHGVACVGGHEEREVRRALRRRQPEPDVDVPVGRHVARGDEPQRRDRLVELGVVDRPERVEDVRAVCHAPLSTSWASSRAAGVSAVGQLELLRAPRRRTASRR